MQCQIPLIIEGKKINLHADISLESINTKTVNLTIYPFKTINIRMQVTPLKASQILMKYIKKVIVNQSRIEIEFISKEWGAIFIPISNYKYFRNIKNKKIDYETEKVLENGVKKIEFDNEDRITNVE